jgi:glutathione S-transferase
MYSLFIANKNYSSWSLRPWVLMQTLRIPFEEYLHVFGEGSNWQAFRAFSPTGKVPCLRTGHDTIWDSLAIAEYLSEHHPGVWPVDAAARAWARCAAAEMHSELWAQGLHRFGGPFLADDRFTAVDAFFAPVAFRVQTYGLSLSDEAMAYVTRLLALPAMQQWYAQALQETWRDQGHEAAVLQYGALTADLRQTSV